MIYANRRLMIAAAMKNAARSRMLASTHPVIAGPGNRRSWNTVVASPVLPTWRRTERTKGPWFLTGKSLRQTCAVETSARSRDREPVSRAFRDVASFEYGAAPVRPGSSFMTSIGNVEQP